MMKNSDILEMLSGAAMAFFDLDETITDADTDSLWASWRSRRDLRGWIERAWLAKLYRAFRGKRMVIDEYMRYQRFRIGTLGADEFRAMGRAFFEESGRLHIYRDAEELIALLKKNGCRVVLLTAQNECIAGPYADQLAMDAMIANRFHEEGGRFTVAVRPYSFGEGKVVLGRRHAEDAGIPLGRCAFFGDSIYDAPFLEQAGFPFAVNPDPLLAARAREKGWPVLRFSGVTRV
ncbi:MAG: HAD family phosphatase [Spirochaetes bacterium]|nr:HAD family phosphatase [Spirochaetota bacterium]